MTLTQINRLRDNEEAYNRYRLRPRVMTKVGNLDMSAEIFGQKVSPPHFLSTTERLKKACRSAFLLDSALRLCMPLSILRER